MKFLDRFITDKDIRAIKFIPSVPERLVYLGIELDRDGIGFNCQNLFSIWDSFFFLARQYILNSIWAKNVKIG